MASKIPSKSARCIGSSLASARRRPPSSRATIILAHGGDPVALEEHVLGAAQPDALRAERSRDPRVARRVGIGAHLEPADAVCPTEHARERS